MKAPSKSLNPLPYIAMRKGVWHNQLFQHQNPGLTMLIRFKIPCAIISVGCVHTYQWLMHVPTVTRQLFPWRLRDYLTITSRVGLILQTFAFWEQTPSPDTKRVSSVCHCPLLYVDTNISLHACRSGKSMASYLDWFCHIRQNQHDEYWHTYLIINITW